MNIGFIIINNNNFKNTKRLFDTIKKYSSINEIIIINNDIDVSLKKIKNKKLTILDYKDNYSYSINNASDYLIKKYKDIILVVSDSNIIIDSEKDIKDLAKNINSNNVIVAPNIIYNNNLYRGFKIPKPLDDIKNNIPYFNNKIFIKNLLYNDYYYNKDISKVDFVAGLFFLVSSDYFKMINGFDKNISYFYQDVILGVKAKILKKNIIICNNVDVLYEKSRNIKRNEKIRFFNEFKKNQYYFQKEYNNANVFQLFFLKISCYINKMVLLVRYLIN